jgi:hypothetical protein
MLGEALARLESGEGLDERLSSWCGSRRRRRRTTSVATLLGLVEVSEGFARLEMRELSAERLRGLLIGEEEQGGEDAAVVYSVSEYLSLPVVRLLMEGPQAAAERVVATLTVCLAARPGATEERNR